MPAEDVRDLARLYRKASADLLQARDTSAQADIVDYLEVLVGRAYTAIYTGRSIRWKQALSYLSHTWPRILRQERLFVGASWAVLSLGLLASFLMTAVNPDAFDHLLPPGFGDLYAEQHDDLREARFGEMSDSDAAAFSSYLMTNNIRVTINAFALGLTFGVGTLAILFQNGVILGAIAANALAFDQSLDFWALILPHGVVELFAINLGGGAGLMLADALLRPGRRRRRHALQERGGKALLLLGAALPMLIFAGVVEAYVTPMVLLGSWGKLGFASLTLLGLLVWMRAPWLQGETGLSDQIRSSDSDTM